MSVPPHKPWNVILMVVRIDANLLALYQQIVLYFLPTLTTPIFINTMVVFVRLYWFEKRFENIGMNSSHCSSAWSS